MRAEAHSRESDENWDWQAGEANPPTGENENTKKGG